MEVKFDIPNETQNIIKVIGVGGGGSNAVNHMFTQGITGVDFIVCNTDQQALNESPVPFKIQLGATLTEGLGAGAKAEVGKNAAIENIDDIQRLLDKNTKMVFITAGMGGGTGTGAAPVIAKTARDLGVLTVGIVTMPFVFEGKRRNRQAEEGIRNMRECVDTLLVINNDKLREMYGNLRLENAFEQADNILTIAAKGIAETITRTGRINVDFKDIETVMKDSGVALMGSARASGEDRARMAVEEALACPLLNDNQISGAEHILLNITYGENSVLMDEITEITDYIQDEAGDEAEVIWGHGGDPTLAADELSIILIATGFRKNPVMGENTDPDNRVKIHTLSDDNKPVQQTPSHKSSSGLSSEKTRQPTLFERQQVEQRTIIRPSAMNNAPEEKPSVVFKPFGGRFSVPADPTVPSPETPTPTTPEPNQVDEKVLSSTIEDAADALAVNNQEGKADIEGVSTDSTPRIVHQLDESIEVEEKKSYTLDSDTPKLKSDSDTSKKAEPGDSAGQVSNDERLKFINERFARLKNISAQVRTPNGLAQLETTPAYKRQAVNLDEISPSSENGVSRLTISETTDEDGEKKTDLRSNNSFLHDNVD
ncbi:MAG: cell division protein FtsZ [Flavobacteriales bacterium]|nr:cell division protein FtsZ [Flavobacteriales bacterium]